MKQYSKYSTGILQILSVFVRANNSLDLYEEMTNYSVENLNAPRDEPRIQVSQENHIQFSNQMSRVFGSMQDFFERNLFDSLAEVVQMEETMWILRNTNEGRPNPQPTQEDIAGFFTAALTEMKDLQNNDTTHYFQYSECGSSSPFLLFSN